MNENIKYIAGAVAVVGLSVGAVLYVSRGKKTSVPAEPVPVVAAPAPVPTEEQPAIKHPVPAAEMPTPLPPLAESDTPLKNSLQELFGQAPVEQFLVPENVVRHIVVTIDNLTEQKLAERIRPMRRVPGVFTTSGTEEEPVLDPSNYQRYQPLIQLLRSTDTQVLAATYTRYYPLFQEAYESLGHPPQYFNDRVIEVIDHLLAAPEPEGTIELARPNMLYEYADPKLEALSSGHKLMIRMGNENAAVVKEKLRQLRAELVAAPGAPPEPAAPSPDAPAR